MSIVFHHAVALDVSIRVIYFKGDLHAYWRPGVSDQAAVQNDGRPLKSKAVWRSYMVSLPLPWITWSICYSVHGSALRSCGSARASSP